MHACTVIGFKKWVQTEKELSENTAKTAAAGVRGFFAFHRAPLQFRRQESQQLTQAKRKTEDYRFSREDLKRMADVSDLDEKYVLIAGKSFGLRAGDFLKLTRGDLEPYVNREPPICIGPINTEKESVKAYPFIDSDALPIIKIVLEKMSREQRINPEERIIIFEREITLSRILKRLANEAGIKHGNKVVRFHCLRKFLIDRLASHMSESKWKQIVGKKVSESAYVSPDSLRDDYTRAMAETTFQTTLEGDVAKIAKLEALKAVATTMGIGESEWKTLFRESSGGRKPLRIEDQIKFLEERIQKIQRKSDCADGTNCGEESANERLSRSSNFGQS